MNRFQNKLQKLFNTQKWLNDGEIPRELIDDNLKTDVSWVERLNTVKENTDAMMDALFFH